MSVEQIASAPLTVKQQGLAVATAICYGERELFVLDNQGGWDGKWRSYAGQFDSALYLQGVGFEDGQKITSENLCVVTAEFMLPDEEVSILIGSNTPEDSLERDIFAIDIIKAFSYYYLHNHDKCKAHYLAS